MRTITQFSQHVYTTKASAKRAALNAVGSTYLVEDPELRNRFDGEITIGTDMIDVMAVGNCWQWSYTFDLYDVLVRVRYADGTIADVRYAEVAHWRDATTPPAEPEENPVHVAARRVANYLRDRANAESSEQRHELENKEYPGLVSECQEAGIDIFDVGCVCRQIEAALINDNPYWIAEVVLRAESYSLASKTLWDHFAAMAAKQGVEVMRCLGIAEESLRQRAA